MMFIVFISAGQTSSPAIGSAGAAAHDDDHHRRHVFSVGDQAAIAATDADDHSR